MFKFYILYILDLIKCNKVKSISIIIAIVSFYFVSYSNFSGIFDKEKNEFKIVSQAKIENSYLYIVETISDNEIQYTLKEFKEPQIIKDNKLQTYRYHFGNSLIWGAFGWEFSVSFQNTIYKMISCEEDDGKFYYIALGRLIGTKNEQIPPRSTACDFCCELKIEKLSNLKKCPKFKTKQQKRDYLLNKLGV